MTTSTPAHSDDELTTSEILIAGRLPLPETGDSSRADRARRLADQYLQRRRRRLRRDLGHDS